jgi:hypothetical protein
MSQLEQFLKDFADRRLWGQIQIDLQDGKPVIIRQTVTHKLSDEGNNRHADQRNFQR